MSTSERDDRLLREDPALPGELRAAFAAYCQIAPGQDARAALLERIERADPSAALVLDDQRPRRRNLWWLSVLSLAALSLLGALVWRRGLGVAAHPVRSTVTAEVTPPGTAGVTPPQTTATRLGAKSLAQPTADRTLPALVEPAADASSPAPLSAARASGPRLDAPRVGASGRAQSGVAGAVDPAQELALLMRAKRVLPSDAEAALALTSEHQRRFPRGSFAEEREVIAIEALVRSGRVADAEQRAGAFRAAHPRSPHLDRLSVVLREP